MKLKLFLLTAISIVGILLPSSVMAAGPLTVRLGQPKSPTNQNSLKLTFVALEIGGTDNIAVSCFKKSPSDSDFQKFQDITLIPGGNTDYCNVDSSILNSNGTYSFKIIANGVKESSVVTVSYNTSGPSTPEGYSKERIDDCNYKIKFHTANDNETVKVELFRSDSTSISINPNSIASSLTIEPNKDGEIVDRIPVCGKEYFYVLRAVDNSDNVSGTTGDSVTTITTTTTSATAYPTQSALTVASGSQVNEGASATPTTTEEAISGTPTGITSSESGTPAVLGTQTSKWGNLKWLSIPLLLLAAFFFYKSKKQPK